MDYKLISTFLDYCKTHKRLSLHTIRAYKNDLLQFYNSNYTSVETYVEHLTKSNIKSSTLRRKIASLKVFYSYLKYHNLIDENPFNQLLMKQAKSHFHRKKRKFVNLQLLFVCFQILQNIFNQDLYLK